MNQNSGQLNIHGLIIQCECQSGTLLYELLRPFKYFQADFQTPGYIVRVHEAEVPYDTFPQLPVTFSTPRNNVYESDEYKIIDYFGKGAVLQWEKGNSYTIYSPDRNVLLESFYLLVLSLLGQYCDQKGLLRVHALGVSIRNTAVLILLPQGAGKSTLGQALMEHEAFRYISDDDPIVDVDGSILPFPRPLGVLSRESLEGIPDEFIYSVDRMEFGRKYYVDSNHWTDRIETRALRDVVVIIGKRVMNGIPEIRKSSRLEIFRVLIRDAVVGIGLYQGLEFLLSGSNWNVFSKIPILMRRLRRAWRLAGNARPYTMILGRDRMENAKTLKEFHEEL